MLQLPQVPAFPSSIIAEIARNATTVTVRAKASPAPLRVLNTRFRRCVGLFKAAEKACAKVQDRLSQHDAAHDVSVLLRDVDFRPLVMADARIRSLDDIAVRATQARARLKDEIKRRRRELRGKSPRDMDHEIRQRLEYSYADLRRLPFVLKRAKREFIAERRRIVGLQRRANFGKLKSAKERALKRMQFAYSAVATAKLNSTNDAISLIDFASYVIESRALWYGDLPHILERAALYLIVHRGVAE